MALLEQVRVITSPLLKLSITSSINSSRKSGNGMTPGLSIIIKYFPSIKSKVCESYITTRLNENFNALKNNLHTSSFCLNKTQVLNPN